MLARLMIEQYLVVQSCRNSGSLVTAKAIHWNDVHGIKNAFIIVGNCSSAVTVFRSDGGIVHTVVVRCNHGIILG